MKSYIFSHQFIILTAIFVLITLTALFFIIRKVIKSKSAKSSNKLITVPNEYDLIKSEILKYKELNPDFELNVADDEIKEALSEDKGYKTVPEAAKRKNDLGVESFKSGAIEMAISLYNDAVSIFPSYPLALYNLGNAYFSMGKYDEAIENYEKVIMLNLKDEFAYYNLAMSYFKKNEFQEATTYYQKAISIAPGDYTTHYNLGIVYEQLENHDQAIEAYKKAVKLKPDYANAHYNLAELLKFKGVNKQAISEYELYLKYNPEADDQVQVKRTIIELMMK